MDTIQIKQKLHQFVDTGDEQMLSVMYAMIMELEKTDPYSKQQFIEDIKHAEQQIEQGDFLTIEQFEKESQKWK